MIDKLFLIFSIALNPFSGAFAANQSMEAMQPKVENLPVLAEETIESKENAKTEKPVVSKAEEKTEVKVETKQAPISQTTPKEEPQPQPTPQPEPKPQPEPPKPTGDTNKNIHKAYDVRKISDVTGTDLDKVLGGRLDGHGAHFVKYGKEYGIDPAFLTAIAMHETGNGSSDALRRLNNVGGIMMYGGAQLRKFSSIEESIKEMASLLDRLYIKDGLITPETIQKRYAPAGGVNNDPTNLNQYWTNGVTKYWKDSRNSTSQ